MRPPPAPATDSRGATSRHAVLPAITGTIRDRHIDAELRDMEEGRDRHTGVRYDHDKYRRVLRTRDITPTSARRGVPHGAGLDRARWVVERTFAWLHQFKRLQIRYEVRADLHLDLLQPARSIICLQHHRTSF
ncbi:transposase [Streptomyces cinereoruber]|uniref:transposase n=1 Tax=Streptomyces cinereoruber TaxID=67260 RepID=UPI003C2CA5EC